MRASVAAIAVASLLAAGCLGLFLGRRDSVERLSTPAVQVAVGKSYLSDSPGPNQAAEAAKWFRLAAEQGDAFGQFALARLYERGEGVNPNPVEAVKLYRLAATQGELEAQVALADILDQGVLVPRDSGEALKWFRRAAERGDIHSQRMLGFTYAHGRGVPTDEVVAVTWYRRAAEQGDNLARVILGQMYRDGRGVPRDTVEAVKWVRRAAEEHFAWGQYAFGSMYQMGDGLPGDVTEAAKWFRRAAEQGEARAQCALAGLYKCGEGVARDESEAVKWFQLAAEQGLPEAEYLLGQHYFEGDDGPKDAVQAVKWIRLAAEQGFAAAQFTLGTLYEAGAGVQKDAVQAYCWFNLATANGHAGARQSLESIERRLAPPQIAEGQRKSLDFRPRKSVKARARLEEVEPIVSEPEVTGSGFYVSRDGYFVTSAHVMANARRISVHVGTRTVDATLVRQDAANDLALLKCEGQFKTLTVSDGAGLRSGSTLLTAGFPNQDLLSHTPKFSRCEIAGLTGPLDDPRFFQVGLPIQPGNSGGALVDSEGSVVGVVVGRLEQLLALRASGQLPENVSYAVRASQVAALLEGIPGVPEQRAKATASIPDANLQSLLNSASGRVLVYR